MGAFTLYYFDNQKTDAADLTNILYVTVANIVKKLFRKADRLFAVKILVITSALSCLEGLSAR